MVRGAAMLAARRFRHNSLAKAPFCVHAWGA